MCVCVSSVYAHAFDWLLLHIDPLWANQSEPNRPDYKEYDVRKAGCVCACVSVCARCYALRSWTAINLPTNFMRSFNFNKRKGTNSALLPSAFSHTHTNRGTHTLSETLSRAHRSMHMLLVIILCIMCSSLKYYCLLVSKPWLKIWMAMWSSCHFKINCKISAVCRLLMFRFYQRELMNVN